MLLKAGMSYVDHMNDDALDVDSFFANVTKLSLPPIISEESVRMRLTFSAETNSAMFEYFVITLPIWMSWCGYEYLLNRTVVDETTPTNW